MLDLGFRLLQREPRNEADFRQLVVHLEVELGAVVIGLSDGHGGLLVEPLGVQLHAQVRLLRLCALELPLRVERGLLDFRIVQFHQHGVGFHRCARQHQDAFDPTRAERRNPEDFLRHQRAIAAHV